MRIANLSGRTVLIIAGAAVDVARASGGRFDPDPSSAYDRWDELRDWADSLGANALAESVAPDRLGPPTPAPRQVFAIGVNYRDHATETALDVPAEPMVFTKFPSSVAGPTGTLNLPPGDVDWEVELVVVISRRARFVPERKAWDVVAGLTVGQDLSERRLQFACEPPQFSLAKSHAGFSPMGPCLITPDEVHDPDDLEISCTLNAEEVQKSRTSQMIFSVPELIARLSRVVTLLPGDVIFSGTPAGVGFGRRPPLFLADGDELVSSIEGIGEMRHQFRTQTGCGAAYLKGCEEPGGVRE